MTTVVFDFVAFLEGVTFVVVEPCGTSARFFLSVGEPIFSEDAALPKHVEPFARFFKRVCVCNERVWDLWSP